MPEDVVHLSPDLFQYPPATIKLLSPDLGRSSDLMLQGRSIRKEGVLIEIRPPLRPVHPFSVGSNIRFMIRLPHQTEFFTVSGSVGRILRKGVDPEGAEMSILAVRFDRLESALENRFEAFELAMNEEAGTSRSARIPVRFAVEPSGIDLISDLVAVDLSMTGMFIAGRARFAIGKVLKIGFRLPFQKEKVGLLGKVIWSGEKTVPGLDKTVPGFGFQFTEVPPPTRVALATYYARSVPAISQ